MNAASERHLGNGKNLFAAVGLVLLAVLVSGGLVVVRSYNELVAQEAGITAQYKQNQNAWDNYWKKLKEAAQVPDRYAAAVQQSFAGAITGRYGEGGSQAVIQAITEQNPQLDPGVYRAIQQLIEAGRAGFEADQKALLDRRRVYETTLHSFPTNLVAGLFGFPRIDLERLDIVTSDETQRAFETKRTGPIDLSK